MCSECLWLLKIINLQELMSVRLGTQVSPLLQECAYIFFFNVKTFLRECPVCCFCVDSICKQSIEASIVFLNFSSFFGSSM